MKNIAKPPEEIVKNWLIDCNNDCSPWEYDFKKASPNYDISGDENIIKRLINYKNEKGFDCDSSDGSCELTNAIYDVLWGWNYKSKSEHSLIGKTTPYWCIARTGSDTMNSCVTMLANVLASDKKLQLQKYIGCSYGNYYIKYNELSDVQWQIIINKYPALESFIELHHSIGNFTLIPFRFDPCCSFNVGRASAVKDSWDLSLKMIKDKTEKTWFIEYIKDFFHNCYMNNSDEIVPLLDKNKVYLDGKCLPENKNELLPCPAEYNEYLEKLNCKIKSRGKYMTKKLCEIIAIKDEQFAKDYKNYSFYDDIQQAENDFAQP
jgi:hypothetical protein